MFTPTVDKGADKVRWGYLIAFTLLLISYVLTFYSSQQVSSQQNRVNHTTDVIYTLDILSSELIMAESSFRGFIVVKNKQFLTDYYLAPNLIDSTFLKLNELTRDNDIQQTRLDTLKVLIKEKLNILSKGLEIFTANNNATTDSMLHMAVKGKLIMDNIKLLVKKLQTDEKVLMTKRSTRVTTLSNFIKVINIASIVIAIVLAFYSITSFNKQNKARLAADNQATMYRERLKLQIDELYKLNTELVELRSIEKFAVTGRISRTIAHEVRNPLTNINLATEHLRSEIPPGAETDVLFNMITRNSNRINDLISDLLNSTKATQLTFAKVSINEMLDQSLSFAQDRIDLKEIRIVKKYTAQIPVLVDTEKINIAFLNIIVNAIEAMEAKKGVLSIFTENKNNRCVVTISDNGKGMDKESLSKLFEAFYTTKEKGTGLGLTNTQNIILAHNANIYAESKPGIGTSFIITFNHAGPQEV